MLVSKFQEREEIEGKAQAKINLGLWILGKREDGYHEILTFYHKISLCDTIRVKLGNKLKVSMDKPLEGENLVEIAVKKLEEKIGRGIPLEVSIEKHIPIGAGLGGGSSDAAFVLRAAPELLGFKMDSGLFEIAKDVGSDVPFFLLSSKAAIGESRGEKLTPVESKLDGYGVIVFPGFGIKSGWAYNEFSKKGNFETIKEDTKDRIRRAIEEGDWMALRELMKNSFEDVIFSKFPLLKRIKESLEESGAIVAFLSGSGSSIVGVYKEPYIPPFKDFDVFVVTF